MSVLPDVEEKNISPVTFETRLVFPLGCVEKLPGNRNKTRCYRRFSSFQKVAGLFTSRNLSCMCDFNQWNILFSHRPLKKRQLVTTLPLYLFTILNLIALPDKFLGFFYFSEEDFSKNTKMD